MMQSLRNSCQYLQAFYQIPAFGSVRELLAYVARARGKLKKGGVPDMRAAACVIIQDFNQGMIPFYMKPPKRMLEQMWEWRWRVRIRNKGLQIVNDWSTGFDMKAIDDDNLQAVQIAENAFDVREENAWDVGRQVSGAGCRRGGRGGRGHSDSESPFSASRDGGRIAHS